MSGLRVIQTLDCLCRFCKLGKVVVFCKVSAPGNTVAVGATWINQDFEI